VRRNAHHRIFWLLSQPLPHLHLNLFVISETSATEVDFHGTKQVEVTRDQIFAVRWMSRSSHCSPSIVSWVARAVWGLALSWWSNTPLASWLRNVLQNASRSFNRTSQMQNSHYHHDSENVLTALHENPSWLHNLELFGWRWIWIFPLHWSIPWFGFVVMHPWFVSSSNLDKYIFSFNCVT
jgi:hypothetical protein